MRATDRVIAAALFLLAFVPFVWFYGGWGANQEVNFALARALVERRTLQIDDFTVREGDIAFGRGGHIYSNKPPGLSLIAAVPYTLLHEIQRRGFVTFDDFWQTSKRLVTIVVSGAGGALIGSLLYLYGRRTIRVTRSAAVLVSISIVFGTIVFPYSTMLFAHVVSAMFLLLALTLLEKRPLIAGIAAGIAGACFYLSAIAACILMLLAWRYGRKKAAAFIAGGAPFAVGLALYQWFCFGSPFVTPAERSPEFVDSRLVLGFFGAPRLEALWAITFSEYRGLFFCSPILLFSIAGAVVSIRQRHRLAELLAIGGITLLFLFGVSSFNGWHGGAAFGPRYLIPIVPLLAVAMFAVASRARLLWLAGLIVSIAINLAATAVDGMTLDGLTRPLTRYILPTLIAHRVPPETRERLYPDCTTPRCTPKKVALAQDATNLGEHLFGTGRSSSIVPAALWIIIGSTALFVIASRLDRVDQGEVGV